MINTHKGQRATIRMYMERMRDHQDVKKIKIRKKKISL